MTSCSMQAPKWTLYSKIFSSNTGVDIANQIALRIDAIVMPCPWKRVWMHSLSGICSFRVWLIVFQIWVIYERRVSLFPSFIFQWAFKTHQQWKCQPHETSTSPWWCDHHVGSLARFFYNSPWVVCDALSRWLVTHPAWPLWLFSIQHPPRCGPVWNQGRCLDQAWLLWSTLPLTQFPPNWYSPLL